MKFKHLAALAVLAVAATGVQAAQRNCTYKLTSRIQYATGLLEQNVQEPLLLDAYIPDVCDGAPAGVVQPVLIVPGGGFNWVERDRPKIVQIADGLARAGFAAFPIEHRVKVWNGLAAVSETMDAAQLKAYQASLKKSPYPGDQHFNALIAMEDTMKAKAWIASQAGVYNLDMNQFAFLGGSSGACTVLGASYTWDDIGESSPPPNPQAVVDMWGDFYPHFDMEAGEAPILILAGTADPVIDYNLTTDIMKRAKAVRVDSSRVTMPGVKHGLDDADIFNRHILGTNLTIFEGIVQFLEARLRPGAGSVWPPVGQTREMTSEDYQLP